MYTLGSAPKHFEHFYHGIKTRSRRVAYASAVTAQPGSEEYQAQNNITPAKTVDSYTWPDSVAPSREVTPVPMRALPNSCGSPPVRVEPPPAPSQHRTGWSSVRSAIGETRPRYRIPRLGLIADCEIT